MQISTPDSPNPLALIDAMSSLAADIVLASKPHVPKAEMPDRGDWATSGKSRDEWDALIISDLAKVIAQHNAHLTGASL